MNRFFESRAQLFSICLLSLSVLPAISLIPSLLLPVLVTITILHQVIRKHRMVRWCVVVTVLSLATFFIHMSAVGWLSAQAVVTLLTSVLLLKWIESDSDREYRIITLVSTLLAALSSLYLPSLPAMAYLVLIGVTALISLVLINDADHLLSSSQLIAKGAFISLLVLPVTVVLFITMPRIQGPLWDLGLIIGLPIELAIDQDARDIGLKGTLKAGQVSRLKRSDAPVLVAEFSSVVPYKSRLYWRGPVFSDYDGVSWNLPENWDKRSNLLRGSYRGQDAVDQVLTSKRDKVHYEARVSPHAGHWLYSLDMPTGQTPEALISKDLQLLGIRKISWEFKYDISAWLEYTGGRRPSDQEFAAYLAYPEGSNPRLKAYGEELAVKYVSAEERINVLYTHLARDGYKMSLTSEIAEGPNSLDSYFFDIKKGTIEHLASSTAMVLRAAGIPTRLITGYRGGSLIALTDFVVVKQEHAHVWVEAWTDEKGWQRVEAKDLVVPPEKAQLKQELTTKKAQKTATKKNTQFAPTESPSAETAKTQSKPESDKPDTASTWEWLKNVSSGMETWVLNYNPDRQIELLKKSGLRKVDWKNLLAISFIALLVLALIYALFLQVRKAKSDPVVRAFNQLNKRFSKMQLACGDNECPSQWLLRIKASQPDLYPATKQVIDQYLVARYSEQPEAKEKALFIRDVKRLVAMI